MNKHEFTKYEISTYLRDFNNLIFYACANPQVPFFQLFNNYLNKDKRIQYAIKFYYYEMINIYELLLSSKLLTMLYDNYYDYLLESKIESLNIPDIIFVNKEDFSKFSKRQIIKYIRNALNHNDNPNHDLLKFVRINEDGIEKIKMEILLKNTKPIPFHIIIDGSQFISICNEIRNYSTFLIISARSQKPIALHSLNVNETMDNIFMRKFYSRKKLTDTQLEQIIKYIKKENKTKNNEQFFLDNGMEYRDFKYSIGQRVKIAEDLKFWESMGVKGNDVIPHLLCKVMPLSGLKDRVFLMNLILSTFYIRSSNASLSDLLKDAKKVFDNKQNDPNSPFYLYTKTYGLDKRIIFDAMDFDNIASLTNSIYFGYIFDSLITDEDIIINENKKIKREKLRNSFVHMRWFKGIKECYKLFDWGNSIEDEFNFDSKSFWSTNIPLTDMINCAEFYFKSAIEQKDKNQVYMDMPIHIKSEYLYSGIQVATSISFIKNSEFYYLEVLNENDYKLLVCDESQIQREATDEQVEIFINELEHLSDIEKNDFSDILHNIKKHYMKVTKK